MTAEDVEEVAGDILAIFERDRGWGRDEVVELCCGTSGAWVWVVFRCSDWYAGAGDTRYGMWIDVPSATVSGCIGPGESLGEQLWYAEIDCPQVRVEDMAASREEYWLQDGIYWRVIA